MIKQRKTMGIQIQLVKGLSDKFSEYQEEE